MEPEREIGPTLVTILGTESHEVEYVLDGRSCKAPLAPLAIVQLRGGVAEVVALCTKDAQAKTYPVLRGGLPPHLSVRSEAIPEVASQDETEAFLRKVIEVLARREVILDLTHGLRHLAALAFLTGVYLSALEKIRILEVYYGLLRRDAPSPLLELRPLLELVTLAFAAEHLRRTGSPAVLIDRIKNDHSKEAEMIASQLVAVAGSYASGLPLEFGHESSEFVQKYEKRLATWLCRQRIPLGDELVKAITQEISRFAIERSAPRGEWKRSFVLSRQELLRQAEFIDRLLTQEAVASAIMAMEEWTVSWAVLETSDASHWLERATRERAAGVLHALVAHVNDSALVERLNSDQIRVAKFWEALKEVRNALAHSAMRPEEVTPWRLKSKLGKRYERVREAWEWLRACPEVPLRLPGEFGRLLVSPVGRVPGALYSAMSHAGPFDVCLCVCSPETRALVGEVVERVGPPRPQVHEVVLEDPYADLEGADKAGERCREVLARAEEVVVNLTGGTTLMGLAVERLGQEAARLGRRVRRFIVLDTRSRDEQERAPYVVGRAVWLDSEDD